MSLLRLARTLLLLLALAALTAVPVALTSPPTIVWATPDLGPLGSADVGVVVGVIPALLLVLVSGIGAIVAAYAARNLAGQHRLGRFGVLELVAIVALASAVLAPSLPQLALGWTVGGLAVAGLVAHAGTPAARSSRRWMTAGLLIGDAALWTAVVVSGLRLGTLDLGALGSAVGTAPSGTVTLLAALVVVAGLSRSALVPFHRWLPETAEAPSPVSALLHAGLVNGVGVLALLVWPILAASVAARGVLLTLALATALLGTAQMRTRPDVKGRLAASTAAQMGYLGVQVALGLPAAVLTHLVGHGMWKASQFLGAGGAVERARRTAHHGSVAGRVRPLRAAAVSIAVVALACTLPGPWGAPLVVGPASLVPALLATAALTAALLGGWRSGTRAHALAMVVSGAAVVAYLLGLRALTGLTEAIVAPATPRWGEPGALRVTVLVGLLVAVAAGFWALDRRARSDGARRLVDWVARTSLPPTTMGRGAGVPADRVDALVTGAAVPPQDAEVERARWTLRAAADLMAPLWPLESFVASNPLASLETFGFHDALRIGSAGRGSSTGLSGSLFRQAWMAGRVDDRAIERAAAAVLQGPEPAVEGVSRLDVLRETLMLDDTPAPGRRTGPAYVGLTYARVYGATVWGPHPGGAWASLRADAGLDRALGAPGARQLALALPAEPERAVAVLLRLLDPDPAEQTRVVGRALSGYAGWAGHVLWRLRQGVAVPGVRGTAGDGDGVAEAFADLVAPLLLVTALHDDEASATGERDATSDTVAAVATALGLPEAASPELEAVVARVRAEGVERFRLAALEEAVHAPIVSAIAAGAHSLAAVGTVSSPRPAGSGADAQVVTCIDVRSERLRRRLEEVGPYETFGAAGFFGIPLRHVSPAGVVTDRCPALGSPGTTVTETADSSRWSWSTTEGGAALHEVEARPFTAFPLAEASGWLLGPMAALRTAAPDWWGGMTAAVRRTAGTPEDGRLAVVAEDTCESNASTNGKEGFDLGELADLAERFLRSTGLVDLAPVVVLCGHGGAATNNPHVAAYDCGACGGQAGDVSARAMVQVLSDPRVAAELRLRGLDLSATTFVAALHDTTRDRITLLDLPEDASSALEQLATDLSAAADLVAGERAASLPQAPRTASRSGLRRHLERRAADWAQVRPEWGLAGNAALVIGPRALTARSDLDGRVFLQSYRPDTDPDGVLLEALMAGPMAVGQWINMQYWCSTVDPEHFGAGDKTTHNVVVGDETAEHALSGVLTGVRGDLRIGLPWQAVSATAPRGGRWTEPPQHDPVRLLVVICAATSTIDAVLARLPQVALLVMGGWVRLSAVDPTTGELRHFSEEDSWLPEIGERRSEVLDPIR